MGDAAARRFESMMQPNGLVIKNFSVPPSAYLQIFPARVSLFPIPSRSLRKFPRKSVIIFCFCRWLAGKRRRSGAHRYPRINLFDRICASVELSRSRERLSVCQTKLRCFVRCETGPSVSGLASRPFQRVIRKLQRETLRSESAVKVNRR